MDRRKFVLSTGLIAGAATLPAGIVSAGERTEDSLIIKAKKLQKGDTLGVISPGSWLNDEAVSSTKRNIEALGFKVKFAANFNAKNGFIAGTDQQRLDDIHEMFEDPEVDGVLCARGGYGTGRLLNDINYDLIKSNPKVFIGFSDITALHYAIHQQTGLVTFHGPVGASDFTNFTTKSFDQVLVKGKENVEFKRPKSWKKKNERAYEKFAISGGTAEGRLVGGNLSLMCSLLGTPYDLDFSGKLVFIEEIGEKTYRVDRMLTQLLNANKFDSCAGVLLGVFNDCDSTPGNKTSQMLKQVLNDRLGQLGIPVAYGLPIGHIDDNSTIPFGAKAKFNADSLELQLLESGVV